MKKTTETKLQALQSNANLSTHHAKQAVAHLSKMELYHQAIKDYLNQKKHRCR